MWPALSDDHSARILALQYQFEQSQWWPQQRILDLQLQQFSSGFRHAVATVPYYRQRFASWSAGISSWAQYRELPLSTRREVQEAGAAMHSEAPPPEHGPVVATESSGSTGSPLITRGTGWSHLMWYAFLLRDHLWHGRDLGGKLAAIRSKTTAVKFPNWGLATSPYVTGPSVVLGVTGDLDEQLRWLAEENP